MRERAHLVGGSMTVESSPGRGTTICVSVPLVGLMLGAGTTPGAAATPGTGTTPEAE